MKHIAHIHHSPSMHWVGNGFPVRSIFDYQGLGRRLNPFLLMDYAAPYEFPPGEERRGVGGHPHRGFETVTVVYAGELEHRDSSGGGGKIGPGDVQWMTAAGGILHEEFHSEEFTRKGGILEMAQLWVNLPARDKNAEAGYQTLLNADIPVVTLEGGAGTVRVIAGELAGQHGLARTFTPIDLWDVRLEANKTAQLPLREDFVTAILVLRGTVEAHGKTATSGDLIELTVEGQGFELIAHEGATLLVMSGEPIHEPIAAQGPFVMNTRSELIAAFEDFQSGKFGEWE